MTFAAKDGDHSVKRRLLRKGGDELPVKVASSSEFKLSSKVGESGWEEGSERGMRDSKDPEDSLSTNAFWHTYLDGNALPFIPVFRRRRVA